MSTPGYESTDYAPVFLPGLTATFTAAGNITAGDPVEVAGSGTVQKVAVSGSEKYVGVSGQTRTPGLLVTIIMSKVVHDGVAEGAIMAGDQVAASAVPGAQVVAVPAAAAATAADVNTARAIIGIALTTAANGSVVRWMQR